MLFDHTLTERGDSLGCHRQLLSWMRLMTPRSSTQGASPSTQISPLGIILVAGLLGPLGRDEEMIASGSNKEIG